MIAREGTPTAQPPGLRRARRQPLRLVAALLGTLQLCTACFVYVPPRTAPAAGAHLALELSDEGRVAHAARLGPGVLRLAGTLTGMDGDRYLVDVASVTPIRGGELPVSGIQVSLAPRDLTTTRVRTLSRRRTLLVVGAAVGAVVTFLVSKGFKSGTTPAEGPPGGGPDQ